MADLQEDMQLYLQEDEENFTFGGPECTLKQDRASQIWKIYFNCK